MSVRCVIAEEAVEYGASGDDASDSVVEHTVHVRRCVRYAVYEMQHEMHVRCCCVRYVVYEMQY